MDRSHRVPAAAIEAAKVEVAGGGRDDYRFASLHDVDPPLPGAFAPGGCGSGGVGVVAVNPVDGGGMAAREAFPLVLPVAAVFGVDEPRDVVVPCDLVVDRLDVGM